MWAVLLPPGVNRMCDVLLPPGVNPIAVIYISYKMKICFSKWDGSIWIGFMWLRIGANGGHNNKPSGFVREEFLDYVRNTRLFTRGSALCSYIINFLRSYFSVRDVIYCNQQEDEREITWSFGQGSDPENRKLGILISLLSGYTTHQFITVTTEVPGLYASSCLHSLLSRRLFSI
jgi:hypothetical protein